ncbi:MAG: protein TolR [Gammaproteobacteria bacterium]|nr:protein TolR [Gammaproteobacteria bacterium]
MSRSRRKRLMGEINVVPYIDVMLVLLVIFMITAPLLTEGVQVDLVKASAKPIESEEQLPFIVTVTKDGELWVNEDDKASTDAELMAKAAAVLKFSSETKFLVRGDHQARYEQVVRAMVSLQQAGVPKVGLVTESPEGS